MKGGPIDGSQMVVTHASAMLSAGRYEQHGG